jgi:hypothetical protein
MIFAAMKKLSPKQVLTIRCPTCGAAPGEKCELATGQARTDPHRDRRVIAKDTGNQGHLQKNRDLSNRGTRASRLPFPILR